MCLKLDLIAGNVLFMDGSKIRANASIKNTWTVEKCEKVLAKIEKRIAAIIAESESIDKEEEGLPSLVAVSQELGDAKTMKEQVKEVMAELEESGEKTLNTVDKECTRINSMHGTHAGYNSQVVVDDKNGLIVSSDAVSANNDLGQFSRQIDKAQEELGKKCQTAVADSGYAWADDLAKIDKQGVQVIVPTQRLASGREIEEFDKRNFSYDAIKDCYICPKGEVLRYSGRKRRKNGNNYEIENRGACLKCPEFGKCTTAKRGRKVTRLDEEPLRERLEKEFTLSQNQEIYKRRQQKVELVYGHIKRNLGLTSFLLRGLEGVRAEMSMLAICFNLRRMMTILGTRGLIQELGRVMPA